MASTLTYDADPEKANGGDVKGKEFADSLPGSTSDEVAIVAVNEKRDLKRGLEQ